MNLQTSIDLDLKSFFQWWTKELTFLVPVKLRRILSDRTGKLTFSLTEQHLNIHFVGDSHIDQPISLDLQDKTGYQQFLSKHIELEKADCILSLTPEQGVAKLIYLPEAAQENLAQVVGFELDRYTPFKLDQVYYAALPLGKTGLGQLKVLLVLSPKVIVDELLAHLNGFGVQTVRIEYQPLLDQYPESTGLYNLLPEHYRSETSLVAKSVHWLLNTLIFMLLMAVFIYPVWQESLAVDILKDQIKALEKDTRLVDAQQREMDAQIEETQKLIDIKNQTPDLIAVLTELTHQLKDNTWLTNLQYSENHMQIQGQSPAASSLISLLEDTPYFSKVSFVSPLTQDKVSGLERFQISMDVSIKPETNTNSESNNGENP